MRILIFILSCLLSMSCEKGIVKPMKHKTFHVGSNHQNYYYGYTILSNVDTVKVKK